MNKQLIKCPACGWTYNDKNSKVFGHYRVYRDNCAISKQDFIILKCRKCHTQFKLMIVPNQEPLLVEMSK